MAVPGSDRQMYLLNRFSSLWTLFCWTPGSLYDCERKNHSGILFAGNSIQSLDQDLRTRETGEDEDFWALKLSGSWKSLQWFELNSFKFYSYDLQFARQSVVDGVFRGVSIEQETVLCIQPSHWLSIFEENFYPVWQKCLHSAKFTLRTPSNNGTSQTKAIVSHWHIYHN